MAKAKVTNLDISTIDTLVFVRKSNCISTTIDGETVILGVESGKYSGLNEVGTVVWDLLEKPISFSQAQEAILAEFNTTPEQCSEDLLLFFNDLSNNNLIEVTIGPDK